jgi:hypothetical protein
MSERTATERNWLESLIELAMAEVTDAGYDFTDGTADLVYERDGGRFEVTIKELEP